MARSRYQRGRREVLQRFLDRDVIYQTAELRDRFEARARENLVGKVGELGRK